MGFIASFDEFMSGNGIWIVIGILIAALILTTIFLILNVIKIKKAEKENLNIDKNDVKKTQNDENVLQKQENNNKVEKQEQMKENNLNSKKQKQMKENDISTENNLEKDNKEQKISKKVYGVTYDKSKREWVVKKTGSSRASKRFTTKAEALEYAEKLSELNGVGLRVHKKDGKFQKR